MLYKAKASLSFCDRVPLCKQNDNVKKPFEGQTFLGTILPLYFGLFLKNGNFKIFFNLADRINVDLVLINEFKWKRKGSENSRVRTVKTPTTHPLSHISNST